MILVVFVIWVLQKVMSGNVMFRMFDRRLSEKEIVHDEMLQNIPS